MGLHFMSTQQVLRYSGNPVQSQKPKHVVTDTVSHRWSLSPPNRVVTLNSPPQVHRAATGVGASELGKNVWRCCR